MQKKIIYSEAIKNSANLEKYKDKPNWREDNPKKKSYIGGKPTRYKEMDKLFKQLQDVVKQIDNYIKDIILDNNILKFNYINGDNKEIDLSQYQDLHLKSLELDITNKKLIGTLTDDTTKIEVDISDLININLNAGSLENTNKRLKLTLSNNSIIYVDLTDLYNTINDKVSKVSSSDNAIVRFNGDSGDIQNSGVTIDDDNNISFNTNDNTIKLTAGNSDKTPNLSLLSKDDGKAITLLAGVNFASVTFDEEGYFTIGRDTKDNIKNGSSGGTTLFTLYPNSNTLIGNYIYSSVVHSATDTVYGYNMIGHDSDMEKVVFPKNISSIKPQSIIVGQRYGIAFLTSEIDPSSQSEANISDILRGQIKPNGEIWFKNKILISADNKTMITIADKKFKVLYDSLTKTDDTNGYINYLPHRHEGGIIRVELHTWENKYYIGYIGWRNDGSGSNHNIHTVNITKVISNENVDVTVEINPDNNEEMRIHFKNIHTNNHGWSCILTENLQDRDNGF